MRGLEHTTDEIASPRFWSWRPRRVSIVSHVQRLIAGDNSLVGEADVSLAASSTTTSCVPAAAGPVRQRVVARDTTPQCVTTVSLMDD